MSGYHYRSGGSFTLLTPAVRALLFATVIAFFVQKIGDEATGGLMTYWFGLSRNGLRSWRLWQPVSYLFLHGGLWHLLLNMLGLFFFGPEIERALGTRRFTWFYLACGVLGGLGWALISGHAAYCVGASGAVYGILGAFAGMFPERRLTLLLFFIIPVTLSARTLAIGLAVFSLLSLLSAQGQIADAAHLAGGLAGFIYGRYVVSRLTGGRPGFSPKRWWQDWRWRRQRRNIRVWHGPRGDGPAEEEPPSEQEINAALDKLARWGIGSLGPEERDILDRASRRR